MFNKAPDQMLPDPTPERVYAVCKMLRHQSMSMEELREAMTLGRSGNNELKAALSVAQKDLGAVIDKDGKLTLAIDADAVATPTAFRRFVNSVAFSRQDSSFVLFARWYASKAEAVFTMGTWEVRQKTASAEVTGLSKMAENDAYGWRFWAAFLGLGYLSGTALIPNAKVRLQDLLVTEFPRTYKYNESISASDFITWLGIKMPEAVLTVPLPLSVSAGLRTLHELELIELKTLKDAERVTLYPVDGDPLYEFSHITVREGVAE